MRSSTALMAAAALLLLAAADTSIVSRSEEETRRMFVEWKAKHGKTYGSVAEEERRYAFFKDNLRLIDEANAAAVAAHSSSRLGLTVFADLTEEEFSTCCLGCIDVPYTPPERESKLSARYQAADNEDVQISSSGGRRELRWPR
ncbi:hypothetical protein ACP70R_046708 [Stipagrostis hirtigluma subsp. patula]